MNESDAMHTLNAGLAKAAVPFDRVDRQIIALLQHDGRLSNTAVARKLGLAEATVRRRIDRLTRTGALRVVAVLNPEVAGFTLSAIIGISCELKHLDEVASTLAGFPETRYLGYSTGTFDLMVEAFFLSHQHLLDFLTTKVAAISGVTRTETEIILKVAKFSFEWELPLGLEESEGLHGRRSGTLVRGLLPAEQAVEERKAQRRSR